MTADAFVNFTLCADLVLPILWTFVYFRKIVQY